MSDFKAGDRVQCREALQVPEGTIPKGSRGTVTADASSTVATVRVRFDNDPNPNVNYRVVPKSSVRKV